MRARWWVLLAVLALWGIGHTMPDTEPAAAPQCRPVQTAGGWDDSCSGYAEVHEQWQP